MKKTNAWLLGFVFLLISGDRSLWAQTRVGEYRDQESLNQPVRKNNPANTSLRRQQRPANPEAPRNAADIQADRMDYDNTGKVLIGRGNVQITYEGTRLNADYVEYNREDNTAKARGNVVLSHEGQVWQGEELSGNIAENTWDFGAIRSFYDPIHIEAQSSKQVEEGHVYMEDVVITTCDPENMEFYAVADSADVFEERIIYCEHVTFYLYDVPVMYLPTYTYDLDRESSRIQIIPGYSSRDGATLLTSYRWWLNDYLKSVVNVDYRSERGLGGGVDLLWKSLPAEASEPGLPPYQRGELWNGILTTYFTQDDRPYRSEEQETAERAAGIDIDDSRYRVRLSNYAQLEGNNNFLFVEANYLSDEEVLKDFFDLEYRTSPVTENRAALVHVDEYFTASLDLIYQINDEFFSNVNRTPEASFDVPRIQIGDTPFYYESDNSASILESAYSDKEKTLNNRENYDTIRLDTSHKVFFPKKIDGWLNVIPRLGYRGTFYGDTIQSVSRTNSMPIVISNIVVGTTNEVVNDVVTGGGELRSLPEIGMEVSFKSFGIIHEDPILEGNGLRHVIEPYLNYTYIPEPDLLREDLLQFDVIDTLGKQNTLQFGVRNKYQTKLDNTLDLSNKTHRIRDIIDLDVFSSLNLDPEDDQEALGNIGMDLELRILEGVSAQFRASYDPHESMLNGFDSQVWFRHENNSYLNLQHSYVPSAREDRDDLSVLQAEYWLFPKAPIGLKGYSRYDISGSNFEEQQALLIMQTDCIGYGIGGSWITEEFREEQGVGDDDKYEIWFQIWLRAMPDTILDLQG